MRKAVLCFVHNAPELLNVLLQQLLDDGQGETDIYLHIDKKADSIVDKIISNEHIYYIHNNLSITWGNDSMVHALVSCLNEITSQNKPYQIFQICTGQDLMVKPGLSAYLEKNYGNIYIDIGKNDNYIKNLLLHKYPDSLCKDVGTGFMSYVELLYTLLTRTGLIPKKKLSFNPNNLDFYTSYNWSIMPYEVACYINQFLNENPAFLELYEGSRTPEDGFLGTIIMNSPYRDQVIFKDQGRKRGESLTYIKGIDGCHVPTISMSDVKTIESSNCYMARKFNMNSEPEVVKYYQAIFEKQSGR